MFPTRNPFPCATARRKSALLRKARSARHIPRPAFTAGSGLCVIVLFALLLFFYKESIHIVVFMVI